MRILTHPYSNFGLRKNMLIIKNFLDNLLGKGNVIFLSEMLFYGKMSRDNKIFMAVIFPR